MVCEAGEKLKILMPTEAWVPRMAKDALPPH
jgi:hypothetical protein